MTWTRATRCGISISGWVDGERVNRIPEKMWVTTNPLGVGSVNFNLCQTKLTHDEAITKVSASISSSLRHDFSQKPGFDRRSLVPFPKDFSEKPGTCA
ncbi:hypothetical protein [Microseira sp. BLCC-F43]|uniref:hypothetical protein n=1 Tax=Microseira sp. BLCC-F43 TaxID=3153602 RepID=UPI0035B972BB